MTRALLHAFGENRLPNFYFRLLLVDYFVDFNHYCHHICFVGQMLLISDPCECLSRRKKAYRSTLDCSATDYCPIGWRLTSKRHRCPHVLASSFIVVNQAFSLAVCLSPFCFCYDYNGSLLFVELGK